MRNEENILALMVEDDESFATLMRIRMKSWKKNLTLVHASCLAEAVTQLDQQGEQFSIVILDQHLPDGNGNQLLSHPAMSSLTVLAVSADDQPEVPANAVKAGAAHFLKKTQVMEPLFFPLLDALLERKGLEEELIQARIREQKLTTITRLLGTLRHEINNPLGAVPRWCLSYEARWRARI